MAVPPPTKIKIVRDLDDLPPESLMAVAEFVEFLHAKAVESSRAPRSPRRIVKLGGLWQGYLFSEEDIRAARREAWAGLGQGFDA
jgi:hypothetical protein